jgi:hypothetical protein
MLYFVDPKQPGFGNSFGPWVVGGPGLGNWSVARGPTGYVPAASILVQPTVLAALLFSETNENDQHQSATIV